MKKIIILFLLVGLWVSAYSKTPQRVVRIYGLFPLEKISLLQKITKDTLIYSKTDTVYEHAFKWGFFYPHRYRKPYTVNWYHRVMINQEFTAGMEIMHVYTNDYQSESKPIGSDTSDPLLLKWTLFGVFLAIESLIFYLLRLRILYIYDDTVKRYVTIRHQYRKTIISVVVAILIAALIGFLYKSYLLLFLPLLYSIFIFLPKRIWYSDFMKMETNPNQ